MIKYQDAYEFDVAAMSMLPPSSRFLRMEAVTAVTSMEAVGRCGKRNSNSVLISVSLPFVKSLSGTKLDAGQAVHP